MAAMCPVIPFPTRTKKVARLGNCWLPVADGDIDKKMELHVVFDGTDEPTWGNVVLRGVLEKGNDAFERWLVEEVV